MNFFTKKAEDKPDVKTLRETLLHFIKEQLSKTEGGEGNKIKGLHLFMAPAADEKHLYEAAVYFEEEDRFKNEVQRIADDYAIELPQDWAMENSFVDEIPSEAMKVSNIAAGLFVRTQKRALTKSATAYIKVLNGEAEQEVYEIKSTDGKINIGREKKVQGEDGFFRINHIAFPANSNHESNKYISRQHAHIQFDHDSGQFYLYADEGGIPPRNKIKVRSQISDAPIKLYSTDIAHALYEGDQIMLGDSAILEFSYTN
jgi:hypothetical protein